MKRFIANLVSLCSVLTMCSCAQSTSNSQYCKDGLHTLVEADIESTCQTMGYNSIYCTKCDYSNLITTKPLVSCQYNITKKELDNCQLETIKECIWCKQSICEYSTTHKWQLTENDNLEEQDYYYCPKCNGHIDTSYKKIPLTSNYTLGLNGNSYVKCSSKELVFTKQLGADYVYISDIIFNFHDGSSFKASSINYDYYSYTVCDMLAFARGTYRYSQYYEKTVETPSPIQSKVSSLDNIHIEFQAISYPIVYTYQDDSDILYDRYSTLHSYDNYTLEHGQLPFSIDLFTPIQSQKNIVITRPHRDTYYFQIENTITVEDLKCDKINRVGGYSYYSIPLKIIKKADQ